MKGHGIAINMLSAAVVAPNSKSMLISPEEQILDMRLRGIKQQTFSTSVILEQAIAEEPK